MSRSQQSQVLQTAESNSGTDQTTAQKAVTAENADIGNYEAQLSKYAASNPFTEGGELQTTQNQALSGVADAGSAAIANQAETQARRTGENAGAAVATSAEAARANQRQLSADEATSNAARIGDEANYNSGVLQDTAAPVSMEAGVVNPNLSAANQALGTAGSAAQTPGFWDTLGDSFAKSLGTTAGGGNGAGSAAINKYCWIAAELYGGWYEPRTMDVRRWLLTDFKKRWYGPAVLGIYFLFGERIARGIRRWPKLRRVFLPIFNAALAKARGC